MSRKIGVAWFHDVCRMVRGYFNKFPVSHLYIGYYRWEFCLISCKWNTRFSLHNNVFCCRLCTTCITWLHSTIAGFVHHHLELYVLVWWRLLLIVYKLEFSWFLTNRHAMQKYKGGVVQLYAFLTLEMSDQLVYSIILPALLKTPNGSFVWVQISAFWTSTSGNWDLYTFCPSCARIVSCDTIFL
jgi:hypothetical protein